MKIQIKKSHVSIGFLVLIVSLSVVGALNQNYKPQFKPETPKTSAGEITIVTPENKTYTEPESGYYPGTFGFENDRNGNIPKDWVDLSTNPVCIIEVESNLDGHNKVLKLEDPSTTYSCGTENIFPNQTEGTIELWFQKTIERTSCYIVLRNDTTEVVKMAIDSNNNGLFGLNIGGVFEYVTAGYSDYDWFHIRIDFDCGSGKTDIYINNVLQFENKDFFNAAPNVSHLRFSSNSHYAGTYYVDAVSYSWDPHYNIGDNLNEGLLLSYENTTTLDWKGYSLDGVSNKTILGNTTIPMPADGGHNIQVFGNDSINTMYESNIRYFTVDTSPYLNIMTPENKIYTQPDSGYYPGTFGFENDKIGSDPSGWSVLLGIGGTVDVISSLGGHSKVVEIKEEGTSHPRMQDNFSTSHESGTVEFWMRGNDVTQECLVYIGIDMAGGTLITIGIKNDQFLYYAPGAIPQNIVPCTDNTWYHVRVDFECGSGAYQGLSADHFYIYINGQRYGEYGFRIAGNNMEYMRNVVWGPPVVYYFDAIGYSWDPNYNIGDNINEGLLVSYDTNTDFNWTGYSLDGQANKTILGNTTIPMPNDGYHNIQMFGNNSMGTMFESDLRYFSVFTGPPEITINSPIPSQVVGTTAPSYDLTIPGPYDTIWYTLDGGTNNLTANSLTGAIDQSAWSALSDGIITINFYANNSAGMEGSAQVMVFKDSSEESPPAPPGIPGYDLYLLIGALSLISTLLIRKRVKS